MAKKKLRNESEIDKHYDDLFNHPDYADLQARGDAIANEAGQPANQAGDHTGGLGDSAQALADGEKAQGEKDGYYRQTAGGKHSQSDGSLRTKVQVWAKKYGASGGLVSIIVGGLLGVGVFMAPSLAVVHLKEVFTEDLNDQLAAMDIRSDAMLRARLGDFSRGKCTGIKIACGIRGFSDRQLEAFAKAGIDLDVGEKSSVTRKTPVYALTFTLSNGEKVTISDPSKLRQYMGDSNIRSQLRRAYNPLFYSIWDKSFVGKTMAKWKLTKANKLHGSTPAEFDESIDTASSRDTAELEGIDQSEDCSKDADKEACEKRNREREERAARGRQAAEGGSGGIGKVLAGASRAAGIVGFVDSACTIRNTAAAVEAGAKVIRAAQLVQFAMIFLTFADAVKDGKATPEMATHVGDFLAYTDPVRYVVNETSKAAVSVVGDGLRASNPEEVPNPYYQKSAYDSAGAKTAFHNDAPVLTAQSQQFTVGGSLLGTLSGVNDAIDSIPGIDKACGVVQNPFVRMASLAIGIGGFGIGTAASGSASYALSLATPLLEAYLKDMLAGEVVSSKTKGPAAGDAIFSGASTLLGEGAKNRGLKPATSIAELETYQGRQETIKQEYIAMGIEDAKGTPFDVMNQYSFSGMLVRQLLPSLMSGNSTAGSTLTRMSSLLNPSTVFATPSVKAVGKFNPERFKKCYDKGYNVIGIIADVFCNVRYVMPEKEMNMKTEDAYEYMYLTGQVDEEHTVESGSAYETFLKNCVYREAGWGSMSNPEDKENGGDSTGDECVHGGKGITKSQLPYFHVYTVDRTIEEGMDEGPQLEESDGSASTNSGGTVRIATYNILHSGTNGQRDWEKRLKLTANTIKSNNIGVAGLQEARQNQQQRILNSDHLGSQYAIWPTSTKGSNFTPNPIVWDQNQYTLVKGSAKAIKIRYGNGMPAHMVQLKLRNSAGQEFYVLNTHDPADSRGGAEKRYQNSLDNVKRIKELAKDGIPIFFTGDFNNRYDISGGNNQPPGKDPKKLSTCVLTRDGNLQNSWDAFNKGAKKCPSAKRPEGVYVDHVFVSSEIDVTKFEVIPKNRSKGNGSDHPTLYIDAVMPGGAESSSSARFGKVAFPLKGGKSVVKNPAIFKDGTTALGGHDYTAYDIYAPVGTTVRAFASGTVTATHSGDLGLGVSIYNKEAGLVVYYTHMATVSVKEGKVVSPGDPLGVLASVKVYPGIKTDHLHIDASTDMVRQACSRNACSIRHRFRDIGPDLFETYQKLPD